MRYRLLIFTSLLLLGAGLLAGCGQKGPLFLPTRPAAPATSTATPASATTVAAPASTSSSGG